MRQREKRRILQEATQRFDREAEERQQRLKATLAAQVDVRVQSGTSKETAFVEAFSALSRLEVEAILEGGESIQLAGDVHYEVMPEEFVPAYLAITNNRALWSTAPDFERVITNLRFADVDTMGGAQYERGSKALRMSYSPDDFPEAMRRYNPSGQLDATFLFPASEEADTMRMALLARGGFPGPHDEDEKARALAGFRRQAATNVPEWKICPICCHQMKQRTEHAVRCASNRHLFSAPGTDPIIDESDERWVRSYGKSRGFPSLMVSVPLWVIHSPGC